MEMIALLIQYQTYQGPGNMVAPRPDYRYEYRNPYTRYGYDPYYPQNRQDYRGERLYQEFRSWGGRDCYYGCPNWRPYQR